MKPEFICVFGQMRNGKTEIANCLLDYWSKISFASPIKKIVCDTFGVDMAFIEKWKPLKDVPPGFDIPMRDTLIHIGDGFRKIRSTIWIDKALEAIKGNSCCDDGRYINELKATKKYGGMTILVWRPGWENNMLNDSEAQIKPLVDHYVKKGVEGFMEFRDTADFVADPLHMVDCFVRNEGSLQDLKDKIGKLIPVIKEKYGK